MESHESASDQELAENLKKFGFIPGPITPNTRDVYERKLRRLSEGSGSQARGEICSK